MAAISFKSVGLKSTNRLFKEKVSPKPIGIKTPLQIGEGQSGLFQMHFNFPEQIHDNLRNLFLTNYGERLGRSLFGGNHRELAFELTSKEDFDQEAMSRIREAVENSMPFVELNDFESDFIVKNANDGFESGTKVSITLSYNIPKLRIMEKKLVIDLWVAG